MWVQGDPGYDTDMQQRGLAESPVPQPHSGTLLPLLKQKDIGDDVKTWP